MPVIAIAQGILREAIEKVPSLKYAVGLTGIAAALAIIVALTGKLSNPIIPLGLVFIGMILLFVFSAAVSSGVAGGAIVGSILVWSVALVFLVFLGFTVSVFAEGVPCNWATFIGAD